MKERSGYTMMVLRGCPGCRCREVYEGWVIIPETAPSGVPPTLTQVEAMVCDLCSHFEIRFDS